MSLLKIVHHALAFTLELALLGALSYWGFHGDKKFPEKYLWGLGLPVLAIALWWVWAAPKSSYRLEQPFLLIFKFALFGIAAFGLHRSGQAGLALLLAALATLSILMEYAGY